jgi:hypothetical protein
MKRGVPEGKEAVEFAVRLRPPVLLLMFAIASAVVLKRPLT